jgi:hypothetical protein
MEIIRGRRYSFSMCDDTDNRDSEPAEPDPGWGGHELDEAPAPRTVAGDRIAGMSDAQTRSAALICAALILGFASMGFLLRNVDQDEQQPELANCVNIQDQSARLACFDGVAKLSKVVPFKGSAPFTTVADPDL